MEMPTLALVFMVTVATGGVAWVFLYPLLSGERQVEKRKESVAKPERAMRASAAAAAAKIGPKVRREQVEDTLKELEQRQKKAKSPPISVRISQAGLSWSKRQFIIIISAVCGVVAAAAAFAMGLGPLVALGVGFAGGFGLPR